MNISGTLVKESDISGTLVKESDIIGRNGDVVQSLL